MPLSDPYSPQDKRIIIPFFSVLLPSLWKQHFGPVSRSGRVGRGSGGGDSSPCSGCKAWRAWDGPGNHRCEYHMSAFLCVFFFPQARADPQQRPPCRGSDSDSRLFLLHRSQPPAQPSSTEHNRPGEFVTFVLAPLRRSPRLGQLLALTTAVTTCFRPRFVSKRARTDETVG